MKIADEYARTELFFLPLEITSKLTENEMNMLHFMIKEAFMNGYTQRVEETQ